MSTKSCECCRYGLFEDFGYSNYTVEGCTFSCLMNKHPCDNFDRFYGEDKRLLYAQECAAYSEGEPVVLDVEHDEYRRGGQTPLERWGAYTNDAEIAHLLDVAQS